jgi:CheY-like chemotaxis protein
VIAFQRETHGLSLALCYCEATLIDCLTGVRMQAYRAVVVGRVVYDSGWAQVYYAGMIRRNNIGLTRQMNIPEVRTNTPTILLVEDDQEIREAMKRFLEDLGYEVAVAINEADSMRLNADQTQVQLILLNQRMLSDDALAAGRRIRAHASVSNSAPVVVLPFEFRKGFEGTDENMGGQDYKSYMTSERQLEDLLAGLLK